jgi:hypothetical protein
VETQKFSEEKLVRGIARAGNSFMLGNDIPKLITNRWPKIPNSQPHFFKQTKRIRFCRVKTEKPTYDCRIILGI